MRWRVIMLHEINFLDWRNAKRRANRARWVVIMTLCALGILGFEYQRWQAYCSTITQQKWRYSQAQFALKMVTARRQSWQRLAEQMENMDQ
jgi:Tfp pilus assembly protein PilN